MLPLILIGYALALVFIFYLLAKVCDQYFVGSLDLITKKLKISPDVAGATFMAIGSSAPELFTAIIALTKVGSENIGAGTIVGSAIFNVLVIVGASAAVSTAYLHWKPVIRDLGFYVISIVILLYTFRDGTITLQEASIYLVFYVLYLVLLSNWKRFLTSKEQKDSLLDDIEEEFVEQAEDLEKNKTPLGKFLSGINTILDKTFPDLGKNPHLYMRTFWIAILYIAVLSYALVEIAVHAAHLLHISETIIALTILAGGTSIPDLISSIVVARKGHGGMAISNAVGSNTFDILIGLGLPWLVYILIKGQDVVVNTENLISSIFLLFFTVITLLFIIAAQKFKLGQKSGYFLLLLYGVYIVYAIYHAVYPESFDLDTWLQQNIAFLN